MSALAGVSSSLSRGQANLISVLQSRAADCPDQTAFSFLLEGQVESTLTYSRLDERARAIAARLQGMGLAGQRVLLAYPHGLDFITGLFGCFYAGCAAVPTSLPHRRTLDRFCEIVADAGARLVLSTTPAVARYQAMIDPGSAQTESPSPTPWLAVDAIPRSLADRWEMPDIAPGTLALLQYTSGSTSRPKGVMLSHANLMHNASAIYQAFGMETDLGVFWLPPYHDMGLVGGILGPLLAGIPSMLMAPAAFLQQPIAWLAAISTCRATVSGGPNFAYDLCVRRITDEQRASLDLSGWRVAFIGAEPNQPEALERFAAAFAPCGFDPAAFYPCYGLAEATLMVSGGVRGGGSTVRSFHDTALTEHRIEPVPDNACKAHQLVSCGAPIDGLRVAIVDPQTCKETDRARVGEIWVTGASVGQGYWRKPDETRESFQAHLRETGEGPFLRTGDLGFVFESHLYVIGRRDDLIIVRGLNHHPQDLEATARRSHPLLDAGFGAAFAVNDDGESRLVLVQEVTRNGDTSLTPVLEAIRGAALEEHGLALHTIMLVRCGTIPRTSSGKIQRRACSAAFLAGSLTPMAQYHSVAADSPMRPPPSHRRVPASRVRRFPTRCPRPAPPRPRCLPPFASTPLPSAGRRYRP